MHLFLSTYFIFLTKYRQTVLGPLWVLVGPSLFIATLGALYAEIGATDAEEFVPHLTIGLITWTLINGFIIGSATVFQRARAQIFNGLQSLDEIVIIDIFRTMLIFAHQLPIILIVFWIFDIRLGWGVLECLLGLLLLVANGYWACFVFGVLGARFRDLGELFNAIMRISFLATPIIWVPTKDMETGIIGSFLVYNPFYHFVDVIRAPLLGQSASLLSWSILLVLTLSGFLTASLLKKYYSHRLVFWL